MSGSLYCDFYAVIKRIPFGCVATYGQVAMLAGAPGRARQVGFALASNKDKSLPWHRVITAQGKISPRTDGGPGDLIQRLRLEEEGVIFNDQGRISLKRFQWKL